MKNFEVIFVRCCPCFVDVISDVMRLDNHPCFMSVDFADFVKSARQGSFAIETFTMSGTILFTCFNDLATTFAFHKTNCPCFNSLSDEEKSGKGIIPYEMIRSYENLDAILPDEFLAKAEIYGSLKNQIISGQAYKKSSIDFCAFKNFPT